MPYVGEIRMFGGNFAPTGWVFCNGALLPIAEFNALFSLVGTTYGGDGETVFAVPDLRGRAPVHQGFGFAMGQISGQEQVTLTSLTIPAHTHDLFVVDGPATTRSPAGAYLAEPARDMYAEAGTSTVFATPPTAGGSQPHENMMPFVVINFIIAFQGVFPSAG